MRVDRLDLYNDLEAKRNSKLLVYATSHSPYRFGWNYQVLMIKKSLNC